MRNKPEYIFIERKRISLSHKKSNNPASLTAYTPLRIVEGLTLECRGAT